MAIRETRSEHLVTKTTSMISTDANISTVVRIGESRHVMTYTIAAGSSFNMVLSHVDHSDPSTWKQETAVEDMKEEFKNWDPR